MKLRFTDSNLTRLEESEVIKMELQNKTISEINLNIMYLISIKEDLNLFYYTKNKINGMIDLAHSLELIADETALIFYTRLSLI